MRVLWLMPMTFVAGIDGFGWFLPYLAAVGLIVALYRLLKSNGRPGLVADEAGPPHASELEAALI